MNCEAVYAENFTVLPKHLLRGEPTKMVIFMTIDTML